MTDDVFTRDSEKWEQEIFLQGTMYLPCSVARVEYKPNYD